jgi:hypothetical protein
VEIGEITAEQPWMKSIKTSSSIYSYVMNNYWNTNYKADQEGPVTFSYSIRPHTAFDATEAAKFGVEARHGPAQDPLGAVPEVLNPKPRSSL